MAEEPPPTETTIAEPPEADAAAVAGAITIPAFESALKRQSVTWSHVQMAYFGADPTFEEDEVARLVHQRYYESLLQSFEDAEGEVVMVWEGDQIIAGIALTRQTTPRRRGGGEEITYNVHIVNNEAVLPANRDLMRVGSRCMHLVTDCRANLRGQDLRVCLESIYSVLTNILALYERRAKRTNADEPEVDDALVVDEVTAELDAVEARYQEAGQRRAQTRYLGGMLIGLGVVAALGAILTALDMPGDDTLFDLSFIAGAVGALVSVMTRITRGDLRLRFEAGDWIIRLLGMFRPFLGAIFGVLVYAILAAGLVVLDPPEPDDSALFYFVFAFAAGFSERFAQDMLSVSVRGANARAQAAAATGSAASAGRGGSSAAGA